MKQTIKTGLAALVLLLAISCKKESSTIQPSSIAGESSILDEITINRPVSVTIGTQVWMKKNLHVIHYRNGDSIPQVTDPVKWSRLKTGAWCWYNNDSATYAATYGKLYNWHAVNDPRGLAPEGWHVPTDAEWDTLSTFLGGSWVAGGKMKSRGTIEAGTGLWRKAHPRATNSSGFTGLPGGFRFSQDGSFVGVGDYGWWWSATKDGAYSAWHRYLSYNNISLMDYDVAETKENGFSVRCVRD